MSTPAGEPLFAPERWREVRDLLARLEALDAPERDREIERVAAVDDALARAARTLLDGAAASTERLPEGFDRLFGTDEQMPAAVGPFRLLSRLGEGGMGTVYLAERSGADFTQRVALKLLDRVASAPRLAARERRILAALAHPNITAFVDAGTDGGRAWLAMEYVDGEPLLDFCARHALDVRARVALLDQVCAAVAHAHAQLVVHRDLKPSNVYVSHAGVAKLLDFGIAQVLDPSDEKTPATRVFTPEYAAPEQLRGDRVTTATDVYALGLLLYELVVGCRLPTAARERTTDWTTAELARQANADTRAAPAARDGGKTVARLLRGDLGRIIAHALEPSPERRYGSVALLREDLARWLEHRPLTLARPGLAYTVGRFVRRNRLAVSTAAVALLALLALTAVALWQARARADEAERALAQARRAEAMQQFLSDVIRQASPDENGGAPITPHQLLEKGEHLADGFAGQPDLQAEVLAQLGELYLSLSDTDSAGRALQRARALVAAPSMPGSVRARVLLALTQWEAVLAQFDDALAHARESLALYRSEPGTEAKTIAEVDISIAQALDGKGDAAETEKFLREAVARDSAALGDHDDSVAELWLLFGYTLATRGELDEAERASRKGVEGYRAVYGDDGFEVAHALNELALVLAWRKEGLAAAEDALRDAVRIFRKLVGENHQKTISAERNLLTMVERRGRYVDALPQREALVARAERPGISTPRELATQYQALALDYAQVGRFADAETALRRSLVLGEQAQGARNLADQGARNDLGDVLVLLGRDDDAERVLREAIAIQQEQQPDDVARLKRLQASLGELLRIEGRTGEALPLLVDAAALPPSAPDTDVARPLALARLAEAQLVGGDATTAEATARRAVDYAQKAYPADHPKIAFAAYALARADLALGKSREAEALLRKTLELRAAVHPPTHPRMLEANVALAQALEAQGKVDEARAIRDGVTPLLDSALPYSRELRARLAQR
ncbi:serine/threonine-protein kinase [Dokdonella fugitiva]|uniref:Serine/threonine-protein kinase n=1 Tax=Dokdonella fugitiva TaxID=328517 RepID=A0A839EZ71_9GAMM|nr:serine/threonine-protein kinase [Dokdonella fugitiva]MBA8887052.1 serine/threonine-protein kinase [Dokdonella fugitiva]